jgi:hypothetical protein
MSPPEVGGVLRGMGEKFTAHPVTSTRSMTVLIASSPGRSSFGSRLSLANDAGSDDRPIKPIKRMDIPGCWNSWVPMQLWTRRVQTHVMGR